MESRDRIGEASGARETKTAKESETKEEGQAESEANKGQALIADLRLDFR
jgi:hypothetical protein